MRAGHVAVRVSVAVLATALLAACVEATTTTRRGLANRAAPTTTASAAAPRLFDLAPLLARPIVETRRTSHPVGPFTAALRTNELASRYGERGREPLPEGAMLLESLSESADSPASLHYLMTKMPAGYSRSAGDWRYTVLDDRGQILADGPLPLCGRCHAEARREWVFEPMLGH